MQDFGEMLAAQDWGDHDDADALRLDPAMRLACTSSAGLTPLVVEQGLGTWTAADGERPSPGWVV